MRRVTLLVRTLLAFSLASLLASAPLAAASTLIAPAGQDPLPEPSAAPAPIDTRQAEGGDAAIADRISGIFAELPSFSNVTVRVKEGVVVLSGKVKKVDDIARAEAIASRVHGVVTVENAIEREVSVDDQLDTLGGLSGKLKRLWAGLPQLGFALLVALVVGGLGYLIAGRHGFWRKVAPNVFLADLLQSAIRFVFVVSGIVLALDMLQASALLGAVLGGAGVIGLALGFAMRDTVENYVASLLLSWRQPFRANDHIVIDNYEGRVIRLTSRATILMTLDGNQLRIPNSTVFKSVILNYTRNPERRFRFDLGIDANDDPDAARRLGVDVLAGLDFVLDTPEPQARVEQVGDSNIVLSFFGWIDQRHTDFYKARSRAIPAVKSALESAGFALPEPIYRLRFDPHSALPMEAVAPQAQQKEKAPPVRPAPPVGGHGSATDTQPTLDISKMVEKEREARGESGDLLDQGRPEE